MSRLGKHDEEGKAYTEVERLPAGGYVLRIEDVKYEQGRGAESDVIIFRFDIAEGDFRGFFRKSFEENTQACKRWKGSHRLCVPGDDGSGQDAWAMKQFKMAIKAFEDSNNGYDWGWDELTLRGKIVGALFNEKEYSFRGRTGFFTDCDSFIAADRIRKGDFKVPELREPPWRVHWRGWGCGISD